MALGDSFNGFPVVGTDPGFLALRRAEIRSGRVWDKPYEVVIGDRVARETGLGIGDELVTTHGLESDGEQHGDRAMRVVGIAARTGGVVDRIVLTAVRTVWDVHGQRTDHELTALLMKYNEGNRPPALVRNFRFARR